MVGAGGAGRNVPQQQAWISAGPGKKSPDPTRNTWRADLAGEKLYFPKDAHSILLAAKQKGTDPKNARARKAEKCR